MTQQDILFYATLFGFFSLFFGLCIGSFLNVCIWRIPRGESIVRPGSHCPKCNAPIRWYQNIPVLSWLCLGGKCANCRQPISFRYTLVELLTGLLFLTVYLQWTLPSPLKLVPVETPAIIPCYWLLLAGLIVGTFVDFEHFIIPDSVTLGGMAVGPALCCLVPQLQGETVWYRGLLWSVVGEAVGFGTLFLVGWLGEKAFKKEAMGFGDVKLLGAIGAFLGWRATLFVIFASSLLGSVCGLVLMACRDCAVMKRFRRRNKSKTACELAAAARRGLKLDKHIPYGPYLAAGAVIWLFWGEWLLYGYILLAGGR